MGAYGFGSGLCMMCTLTCQLSSMRMVYALCVHKIIKMRKCISFRFVSVSFTFRLSDLKRWWLSHNSLPHPSFVSRPPHRYRIVAIPKRPGQQQKPIWSATESKKKIECFWVLLRIKKNRKAKRLRFWTAFENALCECACVCVQRNRKSLESDTQKKRNHSSPTKSITRQTYFDALLACLIPIWCMRANKRVKESAYLPTLCSNYTIDDIKVNMHAIIIMFFFRGESESNEKKDAIVA